MVTSTVPSPLGPIQLAATDRGLAGLWFEQRRHAPREVAHWQEDPAPFADVVDQLDEYFAGRRRAFDVRLDLRGTDFQLAVWGALLTIPYGTAVTYTQLAAMAGRPAAIRAAGAANGRNQVSIVVPCHRVIGSNGHLTDYGGGLSRKQALLKLEGGR